MDGVYDTFRLVAPEFDSMQEKNIRKYINLYSTQISKDKFGESYELALAYLTAHKLKMLGFGKNNGLGEIADSLRVSSYSEGEVSVSFSTNQSTNLTVDAEFALTVYGLEFLTIKRKVIIPILTR